MLARDFLCFSFDTRDLLNDVGSERRKKISSRKKASTLNVKTVLFKWLIGTVLRDDIKPHEAKLAWISCNH